MKTPTKMGETVVREFVALWRECAECGQLARFKVTFLLANARSNRASKAYGKDDCSWCEDDCAYACQKHVEHVRRNPPEGMGLCSVFPLRRFKHMGFYWHEKKTYTYKESVEELARRIRLLIPDNPKILTMIQAWDLIQVPGFEYHDLTPSLAQVNAALAMAKKEHQSPPTT